jgi:hypothetical protein
MLFGVVFFLNKNSGFVIHNTNYVCVYFIYLLTFMFLDEKSDVKKYLNQKKYKADAEYTDFVMSNKKNVKNADFNTLSL